MMNSREKINLIEKKFLRSDLPKISVGDTVKMKIKVQEADKIRLHPFQGAVIRVSGTGINETFTVRKLSFGEGVERTFPFHSPVIETLKVISKGSVKRAKLYFVRNRLGKKARIKQDQSIEKAAAPV